MQGFAMIDFHVHCYPAFLAKRAVDSVKENYYQVDGTLDTQREWMRQHHVEKSVLLNMATRPDTMANVNRFAEQSVCEEFVPFGSVHPAAENALQEVERLYQQGIRGIKFHTGHQNFDFDDIKNIPLYRKIGSLGMATIVHCGDSAKSPDHLVWPHTVARVIDAFQGAPFICAHMGGIDLNSPELDLLKQMPVLVDTALVIRRMEAKEFGVMARELGVERVLFGTDHPWGDFFRTRDMVENSDLTATEKEKIFYGNAISLLNRINQSGKSV
ncbi:amidohydrolase family protein [uncultured Ruthenibacterium sp.]|uniref:amidohydrolase family protein n=1 Tax=uncultured Ruthenibacterium sp. TaxID=1905347 RepID=UPI00349E4EC2